MNKYFLKFQPNNLLSIKSPLQNYHINILMISEMVMLMNSIFSWLFLRRSGMIGSSAHITLFKTWPFQKESHLTEDNRWCHWRKGRVWVVYENFKESWKPAYEASSPFVERLQSRLIICIKSIVQISFVFSHLLVFIVCFVGT